MEKVNELLGFTIDECIQNNEGMIKTIADKYYSAHSIRTKCEFEDLMQEGYTALVRAYRGYNRAEVLFSTYLYNAINNTINRFVNFKISMIHVPYGAKKRGVEIKSISADTKAESHTNNVVELLELVIDDNSNSYLETYLKSLTKKQLDLVKYLLAGYATFETAEHLNVSHQALYVRRKTIQEKYLTYAESGQVKNKVKLTMKSLSLLKPEYRKEFAKGAC